MSKEAMKLALEALDIVNPREFAQADPDGKIDKAITALREALAEQPAQQGCMRCNTPKKCALYGCSPLTWPSEKPAQQEPVAHAVIAGALFDFMGWLTSRKERLVLSSADNASPAVEAITEFAKMRGLSLNDAKVQDWNTSPLAQRTWVDPNDKTQKQYLPHIGEPVLFCHKGAIYTGKHTGGSFQSEVTNQYFNTWECHWMYLPAAHGIKENT